MASIEQLESGLVKAHQAGDAKAAKTFARAIQSERQRQTLPDQGGPLDAFAQGATLGFADEIVGGVNATIGAFDPELDGTTWMERYEGNRDGVRDNVNAYREKNPADAIAGELTGGLLTGVLGAARAAPIAGSSVLANTVRNVGSTGLLGGAYGVGSSEADNVKDVAKDGLFAGGVGMLTGLGATAVGAGLRKSAQGLLKPDTSKLHNDSVKILEEAGVPLTTGQMTGSSRLKSVETSLGQSITGPRLDKVFNEQRSTLQSKLMEKAGFSKVDIKGGLLTDDAIANAKDKFSTRYSKALDDVKVKLDNDAFIDTLAKVEANHQQFLPTQQKAEIGKLISELIDVAADGDGISGRAYQAIRSRLGKRQSSLAANDPSMANFFKDLKGALDDGFLNSVDDITAASKKSIDTEYSRFKQLEKVYQRNGGQQTESGILPLASLNKESKKNVSDKQWRGLIGSASRVLPDSTPNSGTAARAFNQVLPFGLLSGAAATGTLGIPFAMQQGLSRGIGGKLSRPLDAAGMATMRRGGLLATPATNVLTINR